MSPLRKRVLEEMQLRNLSEATIDSYGKAIWRFTRHFKKSPDQLGPEQVREYRLYLRNEKEDSWSTLEVNRGALKFLYCRVLKQEVVRRREYRAQTGILVADCLERRTDHSHSQLHL